MYALFYALQILKIDYDLAFLHIIENYLDTCGLFQLAKRDTPDNALTF